jgi:type IV secretion system protein VirD4
MQFPTDKLILLRGGIPPIIGTKIAYFSSRFFKSRAFPPPEVPTAPKRTASSAPPEPFRDMTDDEAAGHETRPMSLDDVLTEDCPSFFANMLTLDHNGNVSRLIEEGDENGR